MADNFSATDERASDENPKRAKFDEAVASTKSIGEQAMAAGRELTDRAKELAENSTDTAHRISLMETGLQVAIQEANS